jgi:hypothetical protein
MPAKDAIARINAATTERLCIAIEIGDFEAQTGMEEGIRRTLGNCRKMMTSGRQGSHGELVK